MLQWAKAFVFESGFLVRANLMELGCGFILMNMIQAVLTTLITAIVLPIIALLVGSVSLPHWTLFTYIEIGDFLQKLLNAVIFFAVILPILRLFSSRRHTSSSAKHDGPNSI